LKSGLKEIGVFYQKKESLVNNLQKTSLIFFMEDKKIKCSGYFADKTSSEIKINVINYSTDFNKRNHGIIDESVLQERSVAIIGIGSGGSAIAIDLVRCGVTNLKIVEFDSVSLSNLCRSVYDLLDIGKKKTEAITNKLLKINPRLNLEIHDEDVLEMEHQKLTEIIDASDLIIEATDSVKTKVLINGLAYHSTPVVYPSVYELGKGGDVLFTMPGLPCYECVFKSIIGEMKSTKKGEWDYSTGQTKPMPALISDIQVVVARSVKLALAILTGDRKDSFIEKITEPGCSILFIGNEKNTFIFDKPFQEVWAETEIDPECSCQSLV